MSEEGMVALLNYREDGITRKNALFSYCLALTNVPL
jgi:hypothetical protein